MPKTLHPFYDGLDSKYIKQIEAISELMTYSAGEALFRQGDPEDRIFLVHAGTVAIQAVAPGRNSKTIDTSGPGDYVGWSWIVAPFRAHYDAIAQEDVVVTAIDANALRDLCESNHELGYRVLSRMVKLVEHRLQGTRLLLLDLYGTSQ